MTTKKLVNIYQFQITLLGIKPKIWRRIQVPENYNFEDFHNAIQFAMGWHNSHMHQFEMINPKTLNKDRIGAVYEDDFGGAELIPETKAKIAKYFSVDNKHAKYEYDFGDGWEHDILLEKILPIESGTDYPRCIAGKRACPPEDCGGPWGYEALLETIKDPSHPDYEETMEWLDRKFDPETFDATEIFQDVKKQI